MNPGWAKVPEGARYAGLKPRCFRDLLKSGLIPYSKLPSGTILVRFSDIDEALKNLRVDSSRVVDQIVEETVRELRGE